MVQYYEARNKIIEGGIEVFRQKGPKFTMDDLAKEIGMSKKTIYVVFRDKSALLIQMVDYMFDEIKQNEEAVLQNENLSTEQKLKAVLGVMPGRFQDMDFTQIYSQKEKFPHAYARMDERLESGWETTLMLINKGVEEGSFRKLDLTVFQIIYNAAIERFLNGSELSNNHIEYMDALNQLVDVMIGGIVKRDIV